MTIRATRRPDGAPGRGHSGPPAVRYSMNAPWPGITWGFSSLCLCTWAPGHGVYQVKHIDVMCIVHAVRSRLPILPSRPIGKQYAVRWTPPPPLPRGAVA